MTETLAFRPTQCNVAYTFVNLMGGPISFTIPGFNPSGTDCTPPPPPPPKCEKADKSYPVHPFYQTDDPWSSKCYNNYSGDCSIVDPSTNKDKTIGDWGCNMSALAMLLNYANFPNIDPGLLNDFMKSPNTLFVGHDVNVPATVNALRRSGRKTTGSLQYVPIRGPGDSTLSTPDELASALDNGPVMVAIASRGQAQGHFVVVTGRQCQSGGSYKFSMIDPGSTKVTLGATYIVRGYVKDPSDLSELIVGFSGPNGFITYDQHNAATGLDSSGQIVQNIEMLLYRRLYRQPRY